MEHLQELSDFFTRANSGAFDEKLLFAIGIINQSVSRIQVNKVHMIQCGTVALKQP